MFLILFTTHIWVIDFRKASVWLILILLPSYGVTYIHEKCWYPLMKNKRELYEIVRNGEKKEEEKREKKKGFFFFCAKIWLDRA